MAERKTRLEIFFGGFGGQGIALMGLVLGRALAVHEGKEVVHTRAYGPEARGGASYSSVVISLTGEPVDYPYPTIADICVFMSQAAYDKHISRLREGGVLIVDADLVTVDDRAKRAGKVYRVPATRIAEQLGNRIVANMVMLGFLSEATKVVKLESLEKSVRETVRPRFIEINLRALRAGAEYAKKLLSSA